MQNYYWAQEGDQNAERTVKKRWTKTELGLNIPYKTLSTWHRSRAFEMSSFNFATFQRGASVLERELSARNARGTAWIMSAIRYDVGEICLRLVGLRAWIAMRETSRAESFRSRSV
jgi:hypothetical protein